jgi:CubicO group peptidase (beta-lactamase class C family)
MARILLLLTLIVLLNACSQKGESVIYPADSWEVSTPEKQGVDSTVLSRINRELKAKFYGYTDSLMVVRNGYEVMSENYSVDYERINRGRDQEQHLYNYYYTKWHPFYQESELHTLQSITKSVAALVIGVAMNRGDFPPLNTPVLVYFDGYTVEDAVHKEEITIEDLLTMRSGIFWNEADLLVDDEQNTVTQMENSDDWIQYVLSLPMEHKPGDVFNYNSGGSQLLSAIFKNTTGVHMDEYAESQLFKPLGIDEYYWKKTPKGFADTEGGLYLKAQDLAKIGYLVVHKGNWAGEQLVSAEWIDAMTSLHVEDVDPADPNFNYGYGYQWWLVDPKDREAKNEPQIYAGFGYGNQRLFVVPDLNLVVVFFAWNIYGPQRSTIDLFIEEIVPVVD